MSEDFSLSRERVAGDIDVVAVRGEIDIFTAPALKREIAQAIDSGTRLFVLDLTETSFLDSTALGVIISASKRVRPLGGALAIVNVTPSIAKTFEITGLAELFPIVATRDAATAALTAGDAPV